MTSNALTTINRNDVDNINDDRQNNETDEEMDGFSKHSIKKQFNPRNRKQNERRLSSPTSIVDLFPIDNTHRPTLPSSIPPNIERIKSSEIFIKPSRSIKSISSMNIVKQKSNISLQTTRSTIDFSFLIHETTI